MLSTYLVVVDVENIRLLFEHPGRGKNARLKAVVIVAICRFQ